MARLFSIGLLVALGVVSITFLLPMSAAYADMIHPLPSQTTSTPPSGAPAQQIVTAQMAVAGLDSGDIQARMSELTPEDLNVLAADPRQVNMGSGLNYAILAIAILGVALISILILDSLRAKEQEQYRTY